MYTDKVNCYTFSNNKWKEQAVAVPREADLTVYVNNKKFVNILATPNEIEYLILGFLYSEKIIFSYQDVKKIETDKNNTTVYVEIDKEVDTPENKTFSSGFGKGIMFGKEGVVVHSELRITPEDILFLTGQMNQNVKLYKISGAVHASALCDREKIIVLCEDIGRHNTIDKIKGKCLKENIETDGKILITTGRISSEMLLKSSRMGIAVVVSMKSPTGNSVRLAKELNITLIGHVKNSKLEVYSCYERIVSLTTDSD